MVLLGLGAFIDCISLVNITIPNAAQLTLLAEYTFAGCSSLVSVYIPSNISYIGKLVFYDCKSLNSIIVDQNNSSYHEYEGVLYNFDHTRLLRCTVGKTNFTIPDSVVTIDDGAFDSCTSLTNIIIPESVNIIKDYAFNNCSNLTSVTIPSSVSQIEKDAFRNHNLNLTIYGLDGSYAQNYAQDNNINFVAINMRFLDSIAIASMPTKTIYNLQEYFDISGLQVKALYSDGSEEFIDDYQLSVTPGTQFFYQTGDIKITVNYRKYNITKSADFMIKVSIPAIVVPFDLSEYLDNNNMAAIANAQYRLKNLKSEDSFFGYYLKTPKAYENYYTNNPPYSDISVDMSSAVADLAIIANEPATYFANNGHTFYSLFPSTVPQNELPILMNNFYLSLPVGCMENKNRINNHIASYDGNLADYFRSCFVKYWDLTLKKPDNNNLSDAMQAIDWNPTNLAEASSYLLLSIDKDNKALLGQLYAMLRQVAKMSGNDANNLDTYQTITKDSLGRLITGSLTLDGSAYQNKTLDTKVLLWDIDITSKARWHSSDTNVIEVTSSNGKQSLKVIGPGLARITLYRYSPYVNESNPEISWLYVFDVVVN